MQSQNSFAEPKRKAGGQETPLHPNPILSAFGCTATIENRFWNNVLIIPYDAGCWLWVGSIDRKGYGMLAKGKRFGGHIFAHRFSWLLHFGETNGLNVCHKCDVPSCVRPEHLFLGTQQDNVTDMRLKGRGINPPLLSKLTYHQAEEIKSLYPSETSRALGLRFGVTHGTILRIIHGKTSHFKVFCCAPV